LGGWGGKLLQNCKQNTTPQGTTDYRVFPKRGLERKKKKQTYVVPARERSPTIYGRTKPLFSKNKRTDREILAGEQEREDQGLKKTANTGMGVRKGKKGAQNV